MVCKGPSLDDKLSRGTTEEQESNIIRSRRAVGAGPQQQGIGASRQAFYSVKD